MTCNKTIEKKEKQNYGDVDMDTIILTQDLHSRIQYEKPLYELKKKKKEIVRMTAACYENRMKKK